MKSRRLVVIWLLASMGIAQESRVIVNLEDRIPSFNPISPYSKTLELSQKSRPDTFAGIRGNGEKKKGKEIAGVVGILFLVNSGLGQSFWRENYRQSRDSVKFSFVHKTPEMFLFEESIRSPLLPPNEAYVSAGCCLIPLTGCIIGAEILREVSLQDSTVIKEKKMLGWRRAGIIGAEFLGGVGATFLSFYLAFMSNYPDLPEEKEFLYGYTIGSTLAGGTITWGTGRLFGHKGSLWKSMIGAGLGSILGGWVWNHFDPLRHSESFYFSEILMITAPALGAVIGNNL